MIAVPVAALAFGAVTYDSFTLSADERADRMMGAAQALIAWPDNRPVHQDPGFVAGSSPAPDAPAPEPSTERLLALLPPGTRAIADRTGPVAVRTAAGTGDLDSCPAGPRRPPPRLR